MSDRSSQIFTLEQSMHDVLSILNEIGSKRAPLFGISEGADVLAVCRHLSGTNLGSFCTALTPSVPGRPIGWKDAKWNNVLDNIEHYWGSRKE
jgi:hypothetical protein